MSPSKKFKILFITSELFPFVKTGGLADVSASLPLVLTELGHEVRIVVPKYGAIDTRKFKIHDVVRLKGLSTRLNDNDIDFDVKSSFATLNKLKVQIYFIDNLHYFGSRKSLYTDSLTGNDFEDNDERFILFSKSIFSIIQKLGWDIDIIHVHDWQCGLIPVYLKTEFNNDPVINKIKVLYTIHNFEFQGEYPLTSFEKTGLPQQLFDNGDLIHNGKLNFMKGGIKFADSVNTVSSGYRNELLVNDTLSKGLKDLLLEKSDNFFGVLNGVDNKIWNPGNDKFLPKNYNYSEINNKFDNKKILVERFNLVYNPETPVIGVISRLYDYKGIDLIEQILPELMKKDVQFLLLGTGDRKYHKIFDSFSKTYKDKFACYLGFNDELAHLIEAGADIYLMPSKIEPCGLNQMYSMIYGTVPVVRKTGGLADTVVDFDIKTGKGTGFVFEDYSKEALSGALSRALELFKNKKAWDTMIKTGMKIDFSWQVSAKKYIELYRNVLHNDSK